jgi:hypothetical protein
MTQKEQTIYPYIKCRVSSDRLVFSQRGPFARTNSRFFVCLRYVGDAADVAVESEPGTKCSAVPSSMTLYQISYVNGKPSYSLVAIKPKAEQPAKDSGAKAPKSEGLSCEECGLKFATELRLNWHRSTHDPLKQRKAGRRQLKMARHRYEDAGIVVLGRSSPKPLAKSPYLDVEEAVAVVEEELAPDQQSPALDNRILTFICPSCEFSTSERGAMIDHFTATHCFKSSHLKIEVDERQLVEDTGDNADNTVLQQLESIELACSKCGFSSDNQDDLDFHTCLPSEEQMFSCHLCTYECLTRTGLQSHITRKHKPKPESEPRSYECDACDFKCANKNTLYSHKRKHRPGKAGVGAQDGTSYFCNECDFSAKRKGSLYLHIQRRHKSANDLKQSQARPNFYSCDQCDYTNKNKYEMKVHVIRKHTNEYNHECETCGKKYKIRGDLTNHIRFQHREQPIICDVCGKTCGNSNSLYVHQKFAHLPQADGQSGQPRRPHPQAARAARGRRLRGVRQDVLEAKSVEDTHEDTLGRQAALLQDMRQGIQQENRSEAAPAHTHGPAALRLRHLRQGLHPEAGPHQPQEESPGTPPTAPKGHHRSRAFRTAD